MPHCLVPRPRSLVERDALWVMGLIVRGPPVFPPYRLLTDRAWERGSVPYIWPLCVNVPILPFGQGVWTSDNSFQVSCIDLIFFSWSRDLFPDSMLPLILLFSLRSSPLSVSLQYFTQSDSSGCPRLQLVFWLIIQLDFWLLTFKTSDPVVLCWPCLFRIEVPFHVLSNHKTMLNTILSLNTRFHYLVINLCQLEMT